MKLTASLITLLLVAMLTSPVAPQSHSQTIFYFEIGGGVVSSSLSESLLNNWNRGWTSGLGISYNAASTLQLSVNAAYQNHSYRGDHLQLATPRVIGKDLPRLDWAFYCHYDQM